MVLKQYLLTSLFAGEELGGMKLKWKMVVMILKYVYQKALSRNL